MGKIVHPAPQFIAAVVLVAEVIAEKAIEDTVTEQVEPRVQVVPFTVVATLARAELGMADAETERVGVEVEVATDGTNHVGQLPALAIKLVTDPPPDPAPVKVQVVPVQDPAPAEKEKVNAPATVLMLVTPALPQATPVDPRTFAAKVAQPSAVEDGVAWKRRILVPSYPFQIWLAELYQMEDGLTCAVVGSVARPKVPTSGL